MPLHTQAVPEARMLNALDHPVGGCGIAHRAGRDPVDGLVMGTVDGQGLPADQTGQKRARVDADRMSRFVTRIGLLMGERLRETIGDMLDKTTAKCDIEQLFPAADAEHRHVAIEGCPHHAQFKGGATVLGGHGDMALAGAEQHRIDIEGAAGHHQPVQPRHHLGGEVRFMRQRHGQAARGNDRIHVVHTERVPREPGIAAGLFDVEGDADERAVCGNGYTHGGNSWGFAAHDARAA
ncbi:hypothetical protein GCM10011505_33230 [Tistrella bauzanensis]|uniref:Uncharacterized protein n=1 Tax=Tistrella bauzanensis TaxID=657419 RepID=A0ABQ1IQV7_9PROT|nr:hypothetical protein GCM10011505_33230 [Tistrella bauzanensis]